MNDDIKRLQEKIASDLRFLLECFREVLFELERKRSHRSSPGVTIPGLSMIRLLPSGRVSSIP